VIDLHDRVIAITGASRGLGAGIARAALAAGAQLALCSRGRAGLEASERVLTERLDVRDADAMRHFAREAFERFGRVDLWINNAGALEPVGPLIDIEPESFRALIETNVLGVAWGCRAYLRELRERDQRGVLLNISSGAARKAYRGWSGYCASKAAVDRLSEAIALEEAERVRVHSVAPGVIATAMQAAIREKSPREFPDVGRFIELEQRGALLEPEAAGAALLELAFDPDKRSDEVCIDVRD